MDIKKINVSEFQATCLKLVTEVADSHVSVLITKYGKVVAQLVPVENDQKPKSVIGAMEGSVLRYDDPTAPAIDPDEWSVNR